MRPGDVLAQLASLLRASQPVELRAPPGKVLPFQPGEQVSGEVLEQLPQGRFLVALGPQRQPVDLDLPARFQPGDRVSLTFITALPRPTFQLQEPVQQAHIALSDAGRLLGAVAPRPGGPASVPVVTGTAPLLPAPPASAAELLPALAGAVGRSGLFYEAHQEQWVAGERPLEDILEEPQGRLSPRLQGEANAPQAGQKPAAPEPALQAGSTGRAGSQAQPEGRPAVDPRVSAVVQQQVELLADARFVWRGEVWPRQEMEWEVERDAAGSEEADGAAWTTRLRLSLPRLGALDATLRLDASGLVVRLAAADATAVAELGGARAQLEQALAAAGVRLAAMTVDAGGEAA